MLHRSPEASFSEGNTPSFSRSDIHELSDQERKQALRSVKVFMKRLRDLAIKLKGASLTATMPGL